MVEESLFSMQLMDSEQEVDMTLKVFVNLNGLDNGIELEELERSDFRLTWSFEPGEFKELLYLIFRNAGER